MKSSFFNEPIFAVHIIHCYKRHLIFAHRVDYIYSCFYDRTKIMKCQMKRNDDDLQIIINIKYIWSPWRTDILVLWLWMTRHLWLTGISEISFVSQLSVFELSLLNFKNSSGCLFDRNSIFHIWNLNLSAYWFLIRCVCIQMSLSSPQTPSTTSILLCISKKNNLCAMIVKHWFFFSISQRMVGLKIGFYLFFFFIKPPICFMTIVIYTHFLQ